MEITKDDVFESNAESVVMDALLANGYPRDSIVYGGYSKGQTADFVINDVETLLPLMIIEVKVCRTNANYKMISDRAFKSLKQSYEQFQTPVKTIAAILCGNKIVYIDFTDAIIHDSIEYAIDNCILPPYSILTIGAWEKSIKKQIRDREQKMVPLKNICWKITPFVALILIVLDALGKYELSELRLIIIGTCIGIMLIPCFKEIKVGDFSIKNALEKQKEESK